MLRAYYDPAFLKHQPGGWHPESSARLEAVIEIVRSFSEIEIVNNCRQADRREIELIHSSDYFDFIASVRDKHAALDPDTDVSPGSFEASLNAAGAVIDAARFAMQGQNRRVFCAVRPPGHHAEIDRSRGFCIFNNIAIGAASVLRDKSASRIAIIDWDVHHGNGTQQAFYGNPDVYYISLHQYPFFPGSGAANDTGEGKGEGYNLNIPLAYGSSDDDYREALLNKVLPAIDKFKPDLIMMSAGFDAHNDDPLAGMNLSSEMYGEITKMLVDLAKEHCYGRVVSVLEGGYNLAALKESLAYHMKEMLNE